MDKILFILAQIVGSMAVSLQIIGSSKPTTKEVYFYNGTCNLLFTIQYCLLGAWAGALCCLIATLRNIIFYRYKKRIPVYVLMSYLVIAILLNYSVIHSFIDVLPLVNIVVYSIALWTKDIMYIKIVGLITIIGGTIYDFTTKAFVSLLSQLIDGTVGIISLHKLRKKPKRK